MSPLFRAWLGGVLVLGTALAALTAAPAGAEEVFIEWGGAHRWRVVRASDAYVLVKDLSSEQDAYSWASSNKKKTVAKPKQAAA